MSARSVVDLVVVNFPAQRYSQRRGMHNVDKRARMRVHAVDASEARFAIAQPGGVVVDERTGERWHPSTACGSRLGHTSYQSLDGLLALDEQSREREVRTNADYDRRHPDDEPHVVPADWSAYAWCAKCFPHGKPEQRKAPAATLGACNACDVNAADVDDPAGYCSSCRTEVAS